MDLLAQVSPLKVPSKCTYLPDALKLLFGAISDSSILFFAKQFCLSVNPAETLGFTRFFKIREFHNQSFYQWNHINQLPIRILRIRCTGSHTVNLHLRNRTQPMFIFRYIFISPAIVILTHPVHQCTRTSQISPTTMLCQ